MSARCEAPHGCTAARRWFRLARPSGFAPAGYDPKSRALRAVASVRRPCGAPRAAVLPASPDGVPVPGLGSAPQPRRATLCCRFPLHRRSHGTPPRGSHTKELVPPARDSLRALDAVTQSPAAGHPQDSHVDAICPNSIRPRRRLSCDDACLKRAARSGGHLSAWVLVPALSS